MVERWNIGFQKDISHFNFVVNPAGGGTINPTLHFPFQAEGQNPLFHYSIFPSFQLAGKRNILFNYPLKFFGLHIADNPHRFI